MGIVRSIQKGEAPASKFSKDAQDAAKKMKKSSVKKYAKTKHDDLPNKVKEDRDYKDEYKKFQSSTKAKKYRAELNKYNRQKGTYGNGDGKDASHKGGKIVGFESQSKNRGRAEKSRLKKEINDYVGGVLDEMVNEGNTVNELSLKKLEAAIKELKKKIKKQGRVTNARDEDHLKRLMKVYNDMGGRKIKENSESLNWLYEKCWKGYEKKGMKKMFGKMYPNCVKKEGVQTNTWLGENEIYWESNTGDYGGFTFEFFNEDLLEAEYQGRKVKLGKIMQGDAKKFKVYVKNPKGNVVKVNFGQGGDAKGGTMRIRKSNPKARANFRARHNCDNPGPKHKARYWSCRKW